MSKAVPWSIKGVDYDARELAREAARRAGLTLGEWINTIIAEQAAELGVEPADIDADTRLEAVAARLARLTHRDQPAQTQQRRVDREQPERARSGRVGANEPARAARPQTRSRFYTDEFEDSMTHDDRFDQEPEFSDSQMAHQPEAPRRRAQTAYRDAEPVRREDNRRPPLSDPEELLRAAIRKFDDNTRETQKRTTSALAKVAEMIETSELRRDGHGTMLDRVAERLDTIQDQVSGRERSRDNFARDALDKVASRLENLESQVVQRAESEQQPVRHALARLENRIEALARRPAPVAAVETTLRDIDDKIAALGNRLAHSQRDSLTAHQDQRLEASTGAFVSQTAPNEPPPVLRTPANPRRPVLVKPSVNDAISAIAQRQRDLDSTTVQPARTRLAAVPQPEFDHANPGLHRALPAGRGAQNAAQTRMAAQNEIEAQRLMHSAAITGLQTEMALVTAKLEDMHRSQAHTLSRPSAATAAVDPQLSRLRQDISGMSAALADLAPRSSFAQLEQAMGELSQRIDSSRQAGARESLLAPVERLAGDLRTALAQIDPRASLEALHRDIQSIHGKVEGMTGRGLDRASFERVQAQSQEIRDLLAAAIVRPLPVENIERQIVALAARVEDISAQGQRAGAQKPDLSGIATEIGNIIDRALPRSVLQMLEQRLEALDTKIDESISRSQGNHHLAELALRMDDVQRALTRPQADAPDIRPLERMMMDLSAKLDCARTPLPESEPADHAMMRGLESQMAGLGRTLAAQLESAHLGLAAKASSHFDTLSQRIEAVQHKAAVQSLSNGDQGSLEVILRDLSAAMTAARSPDVSMQALQAVEVQLGRIAERLERSNQGLSALSSDTTRKFDSLSRHIETVQSSVTGQLQAARSGPVAAKTAEASALEEMMRALSTKLDTARAPDATSQAIEALETQVARMAGQMDAVRAAASGVSGPNTAALESMVRHLADKFEAAHAPGASSQAIETLENHVVALAQRLDSPDHGIAALGDLERSVGQLYHRIEETRDVAIDAAEAAARIAARDTVREAITSGAASASPELAREIANVRTLQDESGRRTHSTLSAVHDTLEKVVNRLTNLESEVADTRPADAPFVERRTPSAPPFIGGVERRIAIAPVFAEGDDFLIEPRQGKPIAALVPQSGDARRPILATPQVGSAQSSKATAIAGLDDQLEPESSQGTPVPDRSAQQNFIAAARRAAQAAAVQSVSDLHATRTGAADGKASGTLAAKTDAARGYLASHKRSLFVISMSLLLVFGTIALIHTLGLGKSAPVKAVDAAKTLALPQKPASEAASNPAPMTPEPQPKQRDGALLDETAKTGMDKLAFAGPARIDPSPVGSIGVAMPKAGFVGSNAPSAEAIAASVLKQAAAGNPSAQFEAGVLQTEGRGLDRDAKAAAAWFEKAANQDLAPAQYRLGTLLEKGIGVAKDTAFARVWYRRAAEAGNAGAMHNLAVLIAAGDGDKPDYAGARAWFAKAAERGVRDSQFNLAILYARGLGVPKDLVKSYVWLTLAANQGDSDAASKRIDLATRLDTTQMQRAKNEIAAFNPLPLDPSANEVAPPAGGWESLAGQQQDAPKNNSAKAAAKPKA